MKRMNAWQLKENSLPNIPVDIKNFNIAHIAVTMTTAIPFYTQLKITDKHWKIKT